MLYVYQLTFIREVRRFLSVNLTKAHLRPSRQVELVAGKAIRQLHDVICLIRKEAQELRFALLSPIH